MRAAIYLRQSQDRDGNEYGIDRQREDVARLIEQRGWTVVSTYVDNDVSATSRKPRPQFEKMLTDMESGTFEVIVSRHVDRLLRRLSELERVLELCASAGTTIVTAADGVDTGTDGGRLVARILASVGQGEVERKSARQKSAMVQAAKQGRWVGGRRAFGYEADGVTIRETEAAAIREGYAAVLAGEPVTAIAKMWNDAGLPTTQLTRDGTPGTWARSGARDVLLNPRNAGLRRHRPEGGQGEFRKDPEKFIVGKAEWPAIVDEDTYRAAVRVLVSPDRKRTSKRARALLTGVARCHCGSTVNAGGARRHYVTYRCQTQPGHLARKADHIEDYVEAVIVERLSRPDALRLLTPSAKVDTRALSSEADVLRRRRDDLAEDYAIMTRDQFRTANERITSRLAEIAAELADHGSTDLIGPLLSGGDVAAAWAELSTARKRTLIDTLVTVTIHQVGRGRGFTPESVTIDWKR